MTTLQPFGMGEKRPLTDELDIDEPETKRRAQNRAAQRAFRERKEKHLRDLEARLAELEVESRSWKSTNMALRSHLSLLEEELHHYRQNTRPSESGSASGTSASTPPSLSTGTRSSPESHASPATGSPGKAEEFCDQLSMACGTRDRPVPSDPESFAGRKYVLPQIASEVPSWQMPPDMFGFRDARKFSNSGATPTSQAVHGSPATPVASAPIAPTSTHCGASPATPVSAPPALQSNTNGTVAAAAPPPPVPQMDLTDLMNGEFGMFDPLDDMLGWDAAVPESLVDPLPPVSEPNGGSGANASASSTPSHPVTAPSPAATARSAPTPKKEEEVPVAKSRFITCSDVWDRICAHPRFGEIDINNMCHELRTKAKCSDSGVVMTERDLEKVLANY